MSKTIFLSYSSLDKDLIDNFKENLINQDKTLKFIEHTIIEDSEKEWKEKVLEKIKSSDALLCLFGHSTWESEPVKWEVLEAVEINKPVIAVKLKSTVFMIPSYIKENGINVLENDPLIISNKIES